MYAEFSDNLVTGNEMIDSHHKELIDRINKLLDSCEQSNAKTAASRRLIILVTSSIRLSMKHSRIPLRSWMKCL